MISLSALQFTLWQIVLIGDIPRRSEAAPAEHAIELVGDFLLEIVVGPPQQYLPAQAAV